MLKVITCGHSEPCYHLLKRSGGSYYLITLHSKSDILIRVKKIIWSSLYTSSKHFMQALTRSHEFCEKTLSGKCLNFFLCLFVVYSCLGYWLKSIERTTWFWTMEAPGTIKKSKGWWGSSTHPNSRKKKGGKKWDGEAEWRERRNDTLDFTIWWLISGGLGDEGGNKGGT